MKMFTDAAGRTWTIALNLSTGLAVKHKPGIDLAWPGPARPPPTPSAF